MARDGILSGEDVLRENQERFALAVLAANDGLWDWDLRSDNVYFSRRWKAMLGYTEDEISNCAEEWHSRIHPEDRDHALSIFQRHLAGQTPFYELEHRLRHKDGTYRWILARGKALRDHEGKAQRIAGSHTDITERKEVEDELRRGKALYFGLVETSPDSIVVTALDGVILMANKRAAELYRCNSPEDIVGLNVADLVCEGDRARVKRGLHETVEGRVARLQEYTLRRRDGTTFSAEVSASMIVDELGQPRAMMTVARDISERKQAERLLRETESQYRSIFEATSDGIIITDEEGCVAEANPAACAMHGYTREEFVGVHRTAYIHQDRHEPLARYDQAIAAGDRVRARSINVRKDGSAFPVELQGTRFLYKGRPHILAVLRDVTEQARAYELLEVRVIERTRELTTLLDVSRQVASTLQLEPLLSLILEQLETMVEYSSGSICSIRDGRLEILGYRGPVPPSERDRVRAGLEQSAHREEFRRGDPAIVADLWGDSEVAREFQAIEGDDLQRLFRHARSWLGVPLMVGQQLIGMISLVHHQPDFFTSQHAHLALAIGQQAAVAIQNARLYEQAQEVAAHEERARLARELHDSVTQALFSMTMHAGAAQNSLQREGVDPAGRVARNLRQLNELSQGALAEMRALIFELRPGALAEEGLSAALRKHGAALSARERLVITVEAPEDRLPVKPAIEEHLYRLAQEALHNAVKHAGASRVVVRLMAGPTPTMPADERWLTLEIVDDGVGFDADSVPSGHLGLRTMADRAQQVAGTFQIESGPGTGTTVRVAVPGALRAEGVGLDTGGSHDD
ncbi:MAG: PAS domain S-box protein [Chloroflexota bacterium]|nr:PAS domain S-box protein [Chloroflexota bacterium]